MYKLAGQGKESKEVYFLEKQRVKIGRDPGCDVILKHPDISKEHALIKVDKDKSVIKDLGSENGTYINGERIEPGEIEVLLPGDRIGLAGHVFTLYSDEQPVAEDTVALHKDSIRPKGPPIAFDPETDAKSSKTDTIKMDRDQMEKYGGLDPEKPMPELTIVSGEGKDASFTITAGEFHIGRGSKSHLRLADTGASESHAIIVKRKGRYYAYDQNSLNGTFINGTRSRGADLSDGDLILIGKTVVRFTDPDSPPSEIKPEDAMKKTMALIGKKSASSKVGRRWFWIALAVIGACAALGLIYALKG